MSKLSFFMNKKEQINKWTKYWYVLFLDENNRSLSNTLPNINEHWERLQFLLDSLPASYYMFKSAYEQEVHTKLPHYFKCLSANMLPLIDGYETNPRDAGRIKGTNVHVIKSFEQCFIGTEEYEKKPTVLFFGGVRELNAMLPYIDKILITRINGDYTDMFEESEIDPEVLNVEMIRDCGITHHKVVKSEKSDEFERLKRSKRKEQRVELLSDHIKITYSNSTIREKMAAIPDIYNYQFEEYTWTPAYQKSLPDPLEGLKGKKKKAVLHDLYWDDRRLANATRDRINAITSENSTHLTVLEERQERIAAIEKREKVEVVITDNEAYRPISSFQFDKELKLNDDAPAPVITSAARIIATFKKE